MGALIQRLAPASLIALPAAIVVALLVWWWGGLTPPLLEKHAPVGQPFAFGFMLSLLGLFGVFYLPMMQPDKDRTLWRNWMMPACVAIAVALTLLQPTSMTKAEGRWGGPVWELVELMPTVAQRSIVFPPLAALGAVVLLTGCRRASALGRSFDASVLLVALMCFTVAHAVQPWCAQRYFEPMALVFVMWLGALCIEPRATSRPPMRLWLGPAALAAIQLGLSCYAVYWKSHLAE